MRSLPSLLVLLAVPVGAQISTLVPQTFCVQQRYGTIVPWVLYVDTSVTDYLSVYLELPTQAPQNFSSIYDIYNEYALTGYSAPYLSNVASNVIFAGDGGSLVTQYQMVHLWVYPDNSLAIDMFDANQTWSNGGIGEEHMYETGGSNFVYTAEFGTAESCIHQFSSDPASDCFDVNGLGYPCAFSNADLTGTPFTMVNDFSPDGHDGSRLVFLFDNSTNQTVNMWAGGNCGYVGPMGTFDLPVSSVVLSLWEHLVPCEVTPSSSASASGTGTPTGTPTSTGTRTGTGTATPSHAPVCPSATPTPPEPCDRLKTPLVCYGDAGAGDQDWHPTGLPYTLTQALPNQCGECWYGGLLSIDTFELDFDLAVDDVSCGDKNGDSGIAVVFYDKLLSTGARGPVAVATASPSPLAGGDTSCCSPPTRKRGQWELRMFASSDGLSLWPSFGLSDAEAILLPAPTPAQIMNGSVLHPVGTSATYKVHMTYDNDHQKLTVRWNEVDCFGRVVRRETKCFTTAISHECGCRDHGAYGAAAAAVGASSNIGKYPPPAHDDGEGECSGCTAGFGFRGWTERKQYAKQAITRLEFSRGERD